MTNTAIIDNSIILTGDALAEFKKAMKISYYKIFKKNGLITEKQFEVLMKMQTESA